MLNLKLKNMKLSLLRDEFELNDSEIVQALVNLSSRNPEKMVKGHTFFSNMILNMTIDMLSIRHQVFEDPEKIIADVPDKNEMLLDMIEAAVQNLQANSFVDIDCTALSKQDFDNKSDQEAAEIIVANADRVNLFLIIG